MTVQETFNTITGKLCMCKTDHTDDFKKAPMTLETLSTTLYSKHNV